MASTPTQNTYFGPITHRFCEREMSPPVLPHGLPEDIPVKAPTKPGFYPLDAHSIPSYLPPLSLPHGLPYAVFDEGRYEPVSSRHGPTGSVTRSRRREPSPSGPLPLMHAGPTDTPAEKYMTLPGIADMLGEQDLATIHHHQLSTSAAPITPNQVSTQLGDSARILRASEPDSSRRSRLDYLWKRLEIVNKRLHALDRQIDEAREAGRTKVASDIMSKKGWREMRRAERLMNEIKKIRRERRAERAERVERAEPRLPICPFASPVPSDTTSEPQSSFSVPGPMAISPNASEFEYASCVSPSSSPCLRPKRQNGTDPPSILARPVGDLLESTQQYQSRDSMLGLTWSQENAVFETAMLRRREEDEPLMLSNIGEVVKFLNHVPACDVLEEFREVRW